MTRRKKTVNFSFNEPPLSSAEREFFAGFTSVGTNRGAAAHRLAREIRDFTHHLPLDVMTELHNAAYALDTWAEVEDARKLEPLV